MKTTVIYHRADFDGIFCREIARKFLPGAELIGWDFGDAPVVIPTEGTIYVLDLPVDRVFGFDYAKPGTVPLAFYAHGDCPLSGICWIDHHKTSIESHPANIPGYRIDEVAACRLAWQWFTHDFGPNNPNCSPADYDLPKKDHFIAREVVEPWAVRLAGEYDIWDKRDPDAEVFQFGLRGEELGEAMWELLLSGPTAEQDGKKGAAEIAVEALLDNGKLLQRYQQRNDASLVNYRSFMVEWEGLRFLAINHGSFNSLTFAAKDVPETGHDALLGFRWDGKQWSVSLYHARHRTDLDLSAIAKKNGGGGHRGACGFVAAQLPWLNHRGTETQRGEP